MLPPSYKWCGCPRLRRDHGFEASKDKVGSPNLPDIRSRYSLALVIVELAAPILVLCSRAKEWPHHFWTPRVVSAPPVKPASSGA